MIKNHPILAAGSSHNSKLLTFLLRTEGKQAQSVTGKPDAVRFIRELPYIPEYLCIDSLKDWVVQLAKSLCTHGTKILVYGNLTESREELAEILGVAFETAMGSPWKAATVLTGKEYRDEDMDRLLFLWKNPLMTDGGHSDLYLLTESDKGGSRRCERIVGRSFNKRSVQRLGIDAVIDPIKRGFSESQGSWMGYIADPADGVKLVSFMYDRAPGSILTVREYAKMMNGLIDALVYQKARVIATFPIYLTDESGKELTKRQDDAAVMNYLDSWLESHPDKDVRLLYIDGYTPKV